MICRAAATLSYDDRERATAGLRGQLRLMALAAGGTPDWATLAVDGPAESVGLLGRPWFRWTATVEIHSGDEKCEASLGRDLPGCTRCTETLLGQAEAPRPPAR